MHPHNNARLETAASKPKFVSSFAGRHRLVTADSFYEWKSLPSGKNQPYRIMLKSGEPFAMARIYARGDTEDDPVTFAILTTRANELMASIHERMPVILPLHHEETWLPPNPSGMFIFPPFPSELMTAYPVNPKMSRAPRSTSPKPSMPTSGLLAS
jgi:putative SOS response-associated peptidase YedK